MKRVVARAIYDCSIPVISAVGHEIDFTIADFVADLRAPTPTGAAELAVPNKADVINYIDQLKLRSVKNINTILELKKKRLLKVKDSYILNNPIDLYASKTMKLDYLEDRLVTNYKNLLDRKKAKLNLVLTKDVLANHKLSLIRKSMIIFF